MNVDSSSFQARSSLGSVWQPTGPQLRLDTAQTAEQRGEARLSVDQERHSLSLAPILHRRAVLSLGVARQVPSEPCHTDHTGSVCVIQILCGSNQHVSSR